MNSEHVISDEALKDVLTALENNHTWIVYDTIPYFLDRDDIKCFRTEYEATEWAFENNSKTEAYRPIHINSVRDLFLQVEYGRRLESFVNQSKNNFMNQQNLDYLKENLRYMGFGEKLHGDLEKIFSKDFRSLF